MLDLALKFLADEVNTFLTKRSLSSPSLGEVVGGLLVDDTGKWATVPDVVGLTLVNIEEERLLRSQLPDYVLRNGAQILVQPELKLNLTLLVHSRPSDQSKYGQSLRFLANVLTFFQAHPTFSPDEYPGLDPRIQQLNVELMTLTLEQLNQMWAYLGSKYLPSMVYRVRMVVLQDLEPLAIATPITSIDLELHDR